jgi:DNA recombination protein RmuC
MSTALKDLTEANARKQAELQTSMQAAIDKMQKSNEEKLEKMRETVDEKLQGTLEKRLGESFKLVSDQLESVQKGLGEMQNLASGVGDLKRVLTNVKNRGGWGEVQLARQLEDMLSPEQYEANVKIKRNSDALVEFAIKLPGRQEGEVVYLPIDSKFPQEDYERLIAVQETGDKDAIEAASKLLERAIKAQAKIIADKYIDVPQSTDFAIMYLPTEGLFAEVVRRPGLASELQNKFRVLITGPTTLMSLLNSLQMGFKTLAIEKSTSDVWKILSAAKAEFQKYGQVWDKLQKQLNTAQNTVSAAKTRTNAIERTLRNVETGAGIEASEEFQAIESLAAEIEAEDAIDQGDEEQD